MVRSIHSDSDMSEISFSSGEYKKRQLLKKCLFKFTKQDLITVWEDHIDFCRNLPHLSLNRTRSQICEDLYQIAIGTSLKNFSLDDLIAKFDLLYTTLHDSKKAWIAYEIQGCSRHFTNYRILEKTVEKCLRKFNVTYHVTSRLKLENMWLRISFSVRHTRAPQVVNVMYQSYFPFLFITHSLGTEKILKQVLMQTFQGSGLEQLLLRSSNLDALLKMVCQKNGDLIDDNQHLPELLRRSHIRMPVPEHAPEITDGNLPLNQEKRKYIDKVFGKYEPPKLEKLTINAIVKSINLPTTGSGNHRIKCSIVLKGSNVIKGLSKLVENGTVVGKLPKYLEQCSTSGSDTFFIEN